MASERRVLPGCNDAGNHPGQVAPREAHRILQSACSAAVQPSAVPAEDVLRLEPQETDGGRKIRNTGELRARGREHESTAPFRPPH